MSRKTGSTIRRGVGLFNAHVLKDRSEAVGGRGAGDAWLQGYGPEVISLRSRGRRRAPVERSRLERPRWPREREPHAVVGRADDVELTVVVEVAEHARVAGDLPAVVAAVAPRPR